MGRSNKHGGSDLSLNRVRKSEEHRGSTPSLARGSGKGQEEVVSTWLQLKEDIETAMGKKEQGRGQYKDLNILLQVNGVSTQ